MRRGRSSMFLLLILIVLLVVGVLYLRLRPKAPSGPAEVATPTALPTVSVVIASQSIAQGAQITADMLTTADIPQTMWLATYFTDLNAVVGQYAKYPIEPGMFLTTAMVSSTPPISLPGSSWATLIPKGMTAISVPVTRLTSAAYGIRDGDRVDVIATMLLVEVDSKFQSILPNTTAAVAPSKGKQVLMGGGTVEEPSGTLVVNDKITLSLTAQTVSGQSLAPFGRVENDPALGVPFYVVPSERQRPRLVSQMVIKNVQVLHVGTFSLTSPQEVTTAPVVPLPAGEATPTPVASPVPTPVTESWLEKPDIITLIVSPQDAVALTYFLYSGAQLTFTLRNPADDVQYDTEAATLSYILAQYNIPVPVALPYTFEPRLDKLVQPVLPNDVIIVTPRP